MSMAFNTRNQKDDERAGDFAIELTKLFKQAYPEENTTSAVLQRFVTGLRPSISRQLLLQKRPDNLEHAIKDAVEIEQTLSFHAVDEDQTDFINAIVNKTPSQASSKDDSQLMALHQALAKVTQRLESLETQLQRQPPPISSQQPHRCPQYRTVGPCYKCGQYGHLQRTYPLNSKGPAASSVNSDSWPQQK